MFVPLKREEEKNRHARGIVGGSLLWVGMWEGRTYDTYGNSVIMSVRNDKTIANEFG